jgi:hypothetical protein
MADDPFVRRLKTLLVPVLLNQRFSGRFPRFTRSIGPLIHEVAFPGTRRGGERSLTFGIGFQFLDGISAFQDGIEYYLPLSSEITQDGWWRYNRDSLTDCESQADNMIHAFHMNSDNFFIDYSSFPGLFAKLTTQNLVNDPASNLPPRPSRNVSRDCLVLVYLWHHLRNENRAREFATLGLQYVGNAAKLKTAFETFLERGELE